MADRSQDIFDKVRLPPAVDEYLRSANPWWEGKPGRVLPSYRRWAFDALLRKLDVRLAPAVVLRGARQVGKTTLLEQVIQHLIEDNRVDPRRILRVQFDEIPSLKALDEPILAIAGWFQNRILNATFNQAAHTGTPAFLFFDEAQNLADWAPQVKTLVDHHTVHVVVTGSSALRIEAGRDSLAGGSHRLTGTCSARDRRPALASRDRADLPVQRPGGSRAGGFWRQINETAIFTGAPGMRPSLPSPRGGYPIVHARAEYRPGRRSAQ